MLSHESCRIATTTESEQQNWLFSYIIMLQLHMLISFLDKHQLFCPEMKYHHSRSLENEVFD